MQDSPTITEAGPKIEQTASPHLPGHKGSASPSLTGGKVLAAWTLSLALHGVGLGAMLLIVFPFSGSDQPHDPPPAHVQVVGEIDAKGVNPSASADVSPPAPSSAPSDMAHFTPNAAAISLGQAGSPSGSTDPLASLRGDGGAKTPGLGVIGIGPGGGEGGGDATRYGLTVGGGTGPGFFGLGGAAPGVRSIVYVVDRSGSMVDTFNAVRAELKRSISALRRSQKFHVIFFNSTEPLENPPGRLLNAIEANKQQFFTFLAGINPGGGTKPERALRRALALEPDLLYLLSDGIGFDPDLPRRLDEWNRERRTKIYTIAYLDQGGRQMLEAIAREHGGEFKFVSEDDLP